MAHPDSDFSDSSPGRDDIEYAVDLSPAANWVAPPPLQGIVRNESAVKRRLRFEGVDDDGFGSAIDPQTKKEYLLNQDTLGFDRNQMQVGSTFLALVTEALFVTKVLEG